MATNKIAAKLTKVMAACHYVQKCGKNTFHNYKYAMAADVLEKVNSSLVENGLAAIVTPELIEFKEVTTKKGDLERLATVRTTITLIDAESGETLQLTGLGSGQDAGDKAIMKAQTASIKYAWMLSLQISTGDDPEADEGTDESTESKPAKKPTAKPVESVRGQASRNTPTKSSEEPPTISESQVKRFYAVVNKSGASRDIAKLIIHDVVDNSCINIEDGKLKWDQVSRAEYDKLFQLFEQGQWEQYFEQMMATDEGDTQTLRDVS